MNLTLAQINVLKKVAEESSMGLKTVQIKADGTVNIC